VSVVGERSRMYIGGAWVGAATGNTMVVTNPATREPLAELPDAGREDVWRAVDEAASAFPKWAATPAIERGRILYRIYSLMTDRRDDLARAVTQENGKPFDEAKREVAFATGYFSWFAEEARRVYGDIVPSPVPGKRLWVIKQPIGVVGAITPWNYPLHQAIAKIAAALAAGCTVVHKPSEVAPLSAYLLAQIAHDAGLPAGVYNMVTGYGPVAGEALVSHPEVDMVSFTGSTQAGRRVGALAAETVKRVALELGGKSANVVLDDADLTAAVKVGVANCLLNSGQTCTAWTRLLVPADRQSDALELAVAAATKYRPGDPTDPATRLGPLVSAAQRDRVHTYIARGVAEGARLVVDGRNGQPERGYFVGPTIFADVDPDATIAQEEIFGPVLSIIAYADEDAAVHIANGTVYGLAGAVWSADTDRAVAFARRLRTGQVDINGGSFNHLAPIGGYKQSGHGRELGTHGLAEFRETKSLQLPQDR